MHDKIKQRIPAYNLQEILVVLVIIGILLLLALPNLMPLISKAKSTEAQLQLSHIYNSQTTYRYMYSKYSNELSEIDFEAPKTVNENGRANYSYEILSATNNSFIARATAITDFNGNGVFNVWEINENGAPKQIVKD
ncbi:prepilin-type N-terminal cleavage/methylation domain-containing protein [Bizionia argentinensis JUB59]|uniref:Prepilin-type N-terminal cleavage/methylation domain-containing protein n=1 Tax=Bizionia argentinensis JUB59 TaxID=1046627 RepID=G2EGY7_9FLAO|nr:prepilin-type N-terminal cleavage/methylation domain-containing protein [Bizionia argentinensis]EGV42278.1 prepilin-type N-terminal cleavage/methylation domain-containing protein [Bizionia argentinensis JUB59]